MQKVCRKKTEVGSLYINITHFFVICNNGKIVGKMVGKTYYFLGVRGSGGSPPMSSHTNIF
jgi:hypothetical protein